MNSFMLEKGHSRMKAEVGCTLLTLGLQPGVRPTGEQVEKSHSIAF